MKPKENEYWLDVDTKKGMEIMRHVKKYCLRKKVSINDYSSLVNVYAVFVSNFEFFREKEKRLEIIIV